MFIQVSCIIHTVYTTPHFQPSWEEIVVYFPVVNAQMLNYIHTHTNRYIQLTHRVMRTVDGKIMRRDSKSLHLAMLLAKFRKQAFYKHYVLSEYNRNAHLCAHLTHTQDDTFCFTAGRNVCVCVCLNIKSSYSCAVYAKLLVRNHRLRKILCRVFSRFTSPPAATTHKAHIHNRRTYYCAGNSLAHISSV